MTDMTGAFFRTLPDFKGKRRLVRLILGRKLRNAADLFVSGKYGTRFIIPNLIENIGFELFLNGVFEKEIVDFILRSLPRKGVFIDLGANIGSLSLPVGKLNPEARIFCVEASPFVIPYLKKNIEINNVRNIVVYDAAATEKDGDTVDFFHPPTQYGKGALTNLFNARSTRVGTITIDKIVEQNNLSKVDLIKVDIEGSEIFAFKGADKLLGSREAPSILFEFVDYAESAVPGIRSGDAQQYLLDKGYHLLRLDGRSLEPLNGPVREGYAMIWATKRLELLIDDV